MVVAQVVVASEPSGAEIWIDGKATGKVTPSSVLVPISAPFSVTLRKPGFDEIRQAGVSRETLGAKFYRALTRTRGLATTVHD